ncbi:olfactory receptor 2G3-like [Emydura macquarii macquarii]|uniref:olfactory receptor 2G3-like n=1 Tax=Emydura macquarii macquarii TaxID=1129001 RepID=UPI00352AF470
MLTLLETEKVKNPVHVGDKNQTDEFVFVKISNHPRLQALLFTVILILYIMSLMGNILIGIIIKLNPALHIPMYYFISNLSLVDICYTSVTIPKMLAILLSEDRTISFTACAAQLYFFIALGPTECFLLASMAYDRFTAICNPLHYVSLMNKRRCVQLVAGSWVSGLLLSLGQTSLIVTLPFCADNRINHFFCDVTPLLSLACGDTSRNEIALFAACILIVIIPSMLILVSYGRIISTILKITSAQQRHKAFSTCSSHLIVIALFYGSATAMYLRPTSSYTPERDKFLALFYSVVTPTLNPIIYSLRSKDIKKALRSLILGKSLTPNCKQPAIA